MIGMDGGLMLRQLQTFFIVAIEIEGLHQQSVSVIGNFVI